ncbi:MAG: YncE family protein [Nitrospira sp.]|nr:YncE family protein [Nitrospira sp.]
MKQHLHGQTPPCHRSGRNRRYLTGRLAALIALVAFSLPLAFITVYAEPILSPHTGHSDAPANFHDTQAAQAPSPVSIDFFLSSLEGQPQKSEFVAGDQARVAFRITDTKTGNPLTGLHPRAWLSARHSEQVARELSCSSKVKNFLRGQLSVQADVDMNSYDLWVLNHDRTISVINPQIAFNITKLEHLITLPAQGLDWALSPDKTRLYVTMPETSSVAVIQTATRTLTRTINLDQAGTPTRLAVHPDGKSVWVGLDHSPHVAVLDAQTLTVEKVLSVEEGVHTLTFSPEGQWAFITNSTDNSVTVIDAQARRILHHIPIGQTPLAIAYSPLTKQAYVGAINGNHLFVIDPKQPQPVHRIAQQPGVTTIQFEPSGRFAFILNQLASQLSILDVTTQSLAGSTPVVGEPDQVAFTPAYAYIRGLASDRLTLIDLASLTHGKVIPVEVQAGQHPPIASPEDIGVGRMMAPLPEGHGIMLASAPDQTIYYYMEGMMVPMGTFQTYKRKPHALLLLDRMLTETTPGVYSLDIQLPRGGKFDVPVLLEHPRAVQCFQVTIGERSNPSSSKEKPRLTISPLLPQESWPPHIPQTIPITIVDAETGQPVSGLTDVQVLFVEQPGTWHQYSVATETNEGIYEAHQPFPRPGVYSLSVKIPSQGMEFSKQSTATFFVQTAPLTQRETEALK